MAPILFRGPVQDLVFNMLDFITNPWDPQRISAVILFPNEYGCVIVRGPSTQGGMDGLYELAVIRRSTGEILSDDDVIGFLDESTVTLYMRQVYHLPPLSDAPLP